MSWLLFLDESGHDHRTMPYEVHGGVAIHASRLWPFIQSIRSLEQATFGAYLDEHGAEIKGSKLLQPERFKWAAQSETMDEQARRKNALNFLNASANSRTPRRDEFTGYGQACLHFSEQTISALQGHGARLFAAMTLPIPRPAALPASHLRRDIDMLMSRFSGFVEHHHREQFDEVGLLVMDRTDKQADRVLAARLERHVNKTGRGWVMSQRVVPSPLFVESDMAYGVQVADLCIYILNWGYRTPDMNGRVREDL